MKFIAVFVALISVACGYQASWTLNQLSEAIQNPATDPSLLPYLEQALNEMMNALFHGQQITAVSVTIPAIDLSTWTLSQLSAAIENPTTDPALMPYLEQALNQMMEAIFAGEPVVAAPVVVPAMDLSTWTLQEIDAALDNPNTNPALVPYLEHALNEAMQALISGNQVESIIVAVPVGLLPVQEPVAPIVPVAPVDAPVSPVSPPAPSNPLVQIIVNVNPQAAAPVAAPELPKPDPVHVVDEAPVSINPVDVIAIQPPQINPVDILHPVPIVAPVGAGDIVGPIV